MYCRPRPNICVKPTTTQVLPARVHPTQCNIVEKTCEYIVPEVFPSHTTNVTNHVYKHVKSFPHTQSNQQTISNQQFIAPQGPVAGASMGPYAQMGQGGFGAQAGAMMPPNAPVLGAMAAPNAPFMGAMAAPNAPVMGAMSSPMYGHHKHHKGCGCKR
ncbi:spore coat protein [bacterium LRH843]|nr:spore coat protein [bacterium LRH843]